MLPAEVLAARFVAVRVQVMVTGPEAGRLAATGVQFAAEKPLAVP
jgi:hypothetical protein